MNLFVLLCDVALVYHSASVRTEAELMDLASDDQLEPFTEEEELYSSEGSAPVDMENFEPASLLEEQGKTDGDKPVFNIKDFLQITEPFYQEQPVFADHRSPGECGARLYSTVNITKEILDGYLSREKTALENAEQLVDTFFQLGSKQAMWTKSATEKYGENQKSNPAQSPVWLSEDGPGEYVTVALRTFVGPNQLRTSFRSDGKNIVMQRNQRFTVHSVVTTEPDRIRAEVSFQIAGVEQTGWISLKDTKDGTRWAVRVQEAGDGPTSTRHGEVYHSSKALQDLVQIPAGLVLVKANANHKEIIDFGKKGMLTGPFAASQKDQLVNLLNMLIDPDIWFAEGYAPSLVFEAGVDLRNCWGDLVGLPPDDEVAVCGDKIFKEMKAGLQAMASVETDSAGQSGSVIVTSLEKFVIKTAAHAREYAMIPDVFPQFQRDILERRGKFDGCWSTGLAPICGAIIDPGNGYWLITRKISLPKKSKQTGEPVFANTALLHKAKDKKDPVKVDWFDLKSPKFASMLRDGKTQLNHMGYWDTSSPNAWLNKDPGFATLFPEGLPMKPCGSRDAAITMEGDSQMLTQAHMTDYSMFAKVRGTRIDQPDWCICKPGSPPRFPIVLQVDPQDKWGSKRKVTLKSGLTFAMGIIDYIERKVAGAVQQTMSTMKPPDEYRDLWSRQFTHYWKLPQVQCSRIGDTCHVHDSPLPDPLRFPAELFSVGDQVLSIQKIKFTSAYQSLSGQYPYYYATQAVEDSSYIMRENSIFSPSRVRLGPTPNVERYKYKIPTWSQGEIVTVAEDSVVVHFESAPDANNKMVFNMKWNQIVRKPRAWAALGP